MSQQCSTRYPSSCCNPAKAERQLWGSDKWIPICEACAERFMRAGYTVRFLDLTLAEKNVSLFKDGGNAV